MYVLCSTAVCSAVCRVDTKPRLWRHRMCLSVHDLMTSTTHTHQLVTWHTTVSFHVTLGPQTTRCPLSTVALGSTGRWFWPLGTPGRARWWTAAEHRWVEQHTTWRRIVGGQGIYRLRKRQMFWSLVWCKRNDQKGILQVAQNGSFNTTSKHDDVQGNIYYKITPLHR